MKTLQNNFTTQEQSKRLLEIGVPADSCDNYYIAEDEAMPNWLPYKKSYSEWRKEAFGLSHGYTEIIPCWSVGRLIEIYEICVGERFERKVDESTLQLIPLREDVLSQIEGHTKMIYRKIDFSKLEELV